MTKQWAAALATDVGADERSTRDRSLVGWTSAAALAKWLEYYRDPHGLTISTGTPNNLVAAGGSVNLDYQLDPHVLMRLEVRSLKAQNAIFVEREGLADANGYATVSMTLSF